MRSKVTFMMAACAALFILAQATDASAYPWFARRIVDNCSKCHVAFPKINDYGQYVKATGYELPELDYSSLLEPKLKTWLRKFPAALRAKLDVINDEPANLKGDVNFREVQFISGGSLFQNKISWWFHKHLVENNDIVSPFDGTPHEAWVQYNMRFGAYRQNGLNFRFGMSELPLRFSPSKTKVSEIPYAIYNAGFSGSSLSLAIPQYGIALHGVRFGGDGYNILNTEASLALVNGKGDFSTHRFSNVFARLAIRVSNSMIGAFGYFGSNEVMPEEEEHGHGDEHAEEGTHEDGDAHMEEGLSAEIAIMDNNFYRLGVDIDIPVTSMLNISGLVLYGRDSNPLALETAQNGSFYGGFVGLAYCPTDRLMLQWRYDMVRFRHVPELEPMNQHSVEGEHSSSTLLKSNNPSARAALANEEEGSHGHHGGGIITSNTDAMIFGIHYLLPVPNYQLRLTTEFQLGFTGRSNMLISGLQFAF